MLSAIVAFSVRYRGIVIALAVATLVYGVTVLMHAQYDVFPEFAPPQVQIQTEAAGLSPEQVEVLVTKPIEDAINGAPGIATVRSQSIQGLSVITAIFAEGTDIYRGRQVLAERLSEVARSLPAGAKAPVLTPLTSSTSTVLIFGITSRTRSLREARTFADWTLRPQLLAVHGVSSISVFGGEVRQFQIRLDPERLRTYRIGIADIVRAASTATGVRGAGFMENDHQRIVVLTEGQLTTPALLAQSVVREANGAVLRLGDLGQVIEGAAPRIGAASVEGIPGLVVEISNQYGTNTRDVTTAVERALADLAPTMRAAGLEIHPAIFRPANFIGVALSNVTHSLLIGGVLVAVVLFFFLADWGAAAVSLTAIPLSLITAIIVLDHFGLTINTLTLGGLAIAIGEVVDDAIIDVENITRRLRENRALGSPRSSARVVFDASLEVRSSVVYATFIVALVFMPILAMTGVQGALFQPLALSYILAIMASLAVALTLTPALALTLLEGRRTESEHAGDPRFLKRIKGGYARWLGDLERHPMTVMMIAGVLLLGALAMLPFFSGSFLPEFKEGHYILHMQAVPGTSLDASLRIGREVTAALRSDPRVRSVAQKVGRAELAGDVFGTYYSEFEVDLVPLQGDAAEAVGRDLRVKLATIPGVTFALKSFLTERIEETVSGNTAQLAIKLFGPDLDSLDVAANSVATMLRSVPGATEVQPGTPAVSPQATVRLNPAALVAYGVPAGDALSAVETATGGTVATQVFEGNRAIDVSVLVDPARLKRPEDLRKIPLSSTGGRIVTLGQVADIARTTGRYSVAHEGARRLQTVTSNVGGRSVTDFTSDVESRLRTLHLPAGVYAEVSGTAAAQAAAQRQLLLRSLLAGAGIVMLLWMAFGDTRRLLLVLANLPFALVGGVLAVFATGGWLSLGSLVGFVTLFGISTRNAIMLISHYDHLVRVEGATWGPETAIRGAVERFTPVLMTALVTALGLVPLALGSGDPGREIEGPLAIVILGGLVSSTALTLLILPTLSLRFGRFGTQAGSPEEL